jgi:hypothetical protein
VDHDGDREKKQVKISEKSGKKDGTGLLPKEERDAGQERELRQVRSGSAESGCFRCMRMDREHRGQNVGAEEQA